MTAALTILRSRFTWSLIAVGIVVLAWLHYQGLRRDLTDALHRADVAEQIARDNAEAVLRADADRRAAVEALQQAQAAFAENVARAREEEDAVRTAPPSEDGPVAPLLEALRQRRFAK